MKFAVGLRLLIAGLLLCSTGTIYAQTGLVDEGLFWFLLQETEELLSDALDQPNSAFNAPLAANLLSWQEVQAVLLANGEVVPVDMSWLQLTIPYRRADLQTLQDRIRALFDYVERRFADSGVPPDQFDALDRILQEARRLEEAPAAPVPAASTGSNSAESGSTSLPLGGLLQFIGPIVLTIAAFALVLILLLSLARFLRTQPVEITDNGDQEAIPLNSREADQAAEESRSVEDYRAAVRFLYLSSLLLLDERGIIVYKRNLTNREHLEQVSTRPELRSLLRAIVDTFERTWYGFEQIDGNGYRAFCTLIDRLKAIG